MSRPNLYYYFSSKEKIFEALLEEVTYSIEQQSSQITDQVELEPEEALRLVIKTHAAWLLKHGTLFRVIVQSESELPDHLLKRHNESKRHILSNVTDIIERGMRTGRFRPADAQVAAFSVIGMCSWTAWWFKADGRRTILDVADSISEMAAQALIRTDSHLNCGDDPLDAIKVLREDITYLEQLLKRDR